MDAADELEAAAGAALLGAATFEVEEEAATAARTKSLAKEAVEEGVAVGVVEAELESVDADEVESPAGSMYHLFRRTAAQLRLTLR